MVGRGGLPFTPEQADAIARREGSLLLSANAGSGKTSVLSERFVRSVLEDDVEPGRILAITFTDKAAGELRTRVRARFVELGRRDRARDLDAAWISTFHGLCARVLRAHAVRAGLDPAFAVLEEAEARDVRGRAFERALAAFLADDARRTRWTSSRPTGSTRCRADRAARTTSCAARGHDAAVAAGGPAASPPDAGALRAPRWRGPTAELDPADARERRGSRRAPRWRGAGALLDAAAPRRSPTSTPPRSSPATRRPCRATAARAYLRGARGVRHRVARHARGHAVALLDELLGRYADAYAAAKRARAALDFDDLELLTRDLLRDAPAVRASYAERFAARDGRRVPGHQRHAAGLVGAVGRASASSVGDELQSIYGFRHADVRIFRAQRAALARGGAAAELAANFRSRPDILHVLDDAMGELHGAAHVPFVAGRAAEGGGAPPAVELLLTDAEAVEAWPAEVLASLPRRPPSAGPRRASSRARIAELVRDEGVPPGDVVVLLRAATDMAVFERALEEQGLSTLAAGGARLLGPPAGARPVRLPRRAGQPARRAGVVGVVGLAAGRAQRRRPGDPRAAARPGARWDALAAAFAGCAAPGEDRPAPPLADLLPEADRSALANFCPWFAAGARAGAAARARRAAASASSTAPATTSTSSACPAGGGAGPTCSSSQRLAAGFEARRGRDVRGLIDLATAELEAEARETDAPVELGDATAIRLMTMHAAKGLEFPVVVVADLGRAGQQPAPTTCSSAATASACACARSTAAAPRRWTATRCATSQRADAEEERRILHVAMTRAEERLILSGTLRARQVARRGPQPAVAPLRWLAPRLVAGLDALAGEPTRRSVADRPHPTAPRPASRSRPPRAAAGPTATPAPIAAEAAGPGISTRPPRTPPASSPSTSSPRRPSRRGGSTPRPRRPRPRPAARRARRRPARRAPRAAPPRPLPATLSYTLARRVRPVRVPLVPGAGPAAAARRAGRRSPRGERPAGPVEGGLDALTRGSLAHALLEDLDFAAPAAPGEDAVRAARRAPRGRADRRRRRRPPAARRRLRRLHARRAAGRRDRRPARARLRRRARRRARAAAQRRRRRHRLRGRRRRAGRRLQVRRRRARHRPGGLRRGRLRRPAPHLRARRARRGRARTSRSPTSSCTARPSPPSRVYDRRRHPAAARRARRARRGHRRRRASSRPTARTARSASPARAAARSASTPRS